MAIRDSIVGAIQSGQMGMSKVTGGGALKALWKVVVVQYLLEDLRKI